MRKIAMAAAILLTATSVANAANLETAGGVLVNAGAGYAAAKAGALKTGDQVMAQPGGSAKLTYADGCTVSVTPGKIAVVQDKSPCSMGQASGAGMKDDKAAAHHAAPNHHSPHNLLIAGAIVGVGAAVIIGTNKTGAASP